MKNKPPPAPTEIWRHWDQRNIWDRIFNAAEEYVLAALVLFLILPFWFRLLNIMFHLDPFATYVISVVLGIDDSNFFWLLSLIFDNRGPYS